MASPISADRAELASKIVASLAASRVKLIFAESLTGGELSSAIVSVEGASKVFLGSLVAYDSSMKQQLLSVSQSSLAQHGAASSRVAQQMCEGAMQLAGVGHSLESVVAVSTTGVAGPETQDGVAVGSVFIGIVAFGLQAVQEFHFEGGRQSIREQTVDAALELLQHHLSQPTQEQAAL